MMRPWLWVALYFFVVAGMKHRVDMLGGFGNTAARERDAEKRSMSQTDADNDGELSSQEVEDEIIRQLNGSSHFDEAHEVEAGAVSYTHLTLPTIYPV